MLYVRDVTLVNDGEAVKQGGKSCIDFVLASKNYYEIIVKVSLGLFSGCLVDILILSNWWSPYPPPQMTPCEPWRKNHAWTVF